MPTQAATARGYHNLWNRAELKFEKVNAAKALAATALSKSKLYDDVTNSTGVPIEFLAPVHMRESGMDFRGVLHNGQHILGTGRKTTLVPKGRGPFPAGDKGWVIAAIDAVRLKGLHNTKFWPVEVILFQQERFNGFGYFGKGVNSPYIWGWTNLQQPGKYIRDGVWDGNAWDVQCGTAAMMKEMAAQDPTIAARLQNRTAAVPKEMVDEAQKEANAPDKRKAAGGAAGTVATGGTKAGTEAPPPTDGTSSTVNFAHAYVLPLAIALFAAFTVYVLLRVARRSSYIKQIAGHAS